ncbi:MAG: bifunctional diguanylate cyclase/phosphodiesterase [Gammaproteobacteria bacterium]|nr:bifunctional diguanylate cyclase/phosphodiesterase [Gammaproteobacteria bacterium]
MPEQHRTVEEQLRRRECELDMLKEITRVISSGKSIKEVFGFVTESARKLLGCETATMPIVSDDQANYVYRAASGKNAEELIDSELPMSVGLCGWVMQNQRPWWRGALDLLDDSERNKWEKDAGTVILVPLIGKQRFLGGIACINKINGDDFDEQDLDLLTMFASHVSIAIENAMAFDELRTARNTAEAYRIRLEKLNGKLQQANGELQFLAVHDPLTGLPNRALIVDRLERGILTAQRDDRQLALIMIDLNNFKDVNDTLGHAAGDQLLVSLGKRFLGLVEDDLTLGRLGGDEFAVVLPGAGIDRALAVSSMLQDLLQQPIDIDDRIITLDASMGVSIYPDHGTRPSDLMKCADVAMYVAKRNKLAVSVYNSQNNPYDQGHLELTRDLRTAIKRNDIDLYLQPKVDMRSGTLIGAEALARWRHPVQGDVPPSKFVPILEQTGLIKEFALQVLEKAVRYCKQCERAGYEISVAVNLSVHNLRDETLPDQVEDILARHDLDSSRLTLEITESAVMDDYMKSIEVLGELSDMGIELSIDDFGTGYSSLGYLKRMPVQQLKIDRSFVGDMIMSRDDAVIVRSTIDLAHNLGLKTVAEGVETEAVLAVLSEMGCDMAQGYLISRPLPMEEFFLFLKNCDWIVESVSAA